MEQLLHYVWKHKLFPLSLFPPPTTGRWKSSTRIAQPQCRARFLQRQNQDQRNPLGGQRGDSRQGERLVSSRPRQGREIRQRDSARLRHHRYSKPETRRANRLTQMQLNIPDNVLKHYQELLDHRPISSLLSDHSIAHQAHRAFVDECPANRTPLAEDGGDRGACAPMQRRLGECLLRNPGAKLSASESMAKPSSSGR